MHQPKSSLVLDLTLYAVHRRLDGNKFTTFPRELLDPFVRLDKLYLSDNAIASLHERTLMVVGKSLTELYVYEGALC